MYTRLSSVAYLRSVRRKPLARWRTIAIAAAAGVLGCVAPSRATVISFDDGAVVAGSILSTQYASRGVTFAPGGSYPGVVNPPGTNDGFATNTDLTISTFDASLGEAAPLGGLVLRSNSGFQVENGDPVFTMTFSAPVVALSLDFGDVKAAFQGSPAIFAVQPTSNVAVSIALAPNRKNGTATAVGLPTGVTQIVVVPGTANDFVALDNLNFTLAPAPVPEPGTVMASMVGVGLLCLILRRCRPAL